MRTDSVYHRESAGSGPEVLKKTRLTGATYSGNTLDQSMRAPLFPAPPNGTNVAGMCVKVSPLCRNCTGIFPIPKTSLIELSEFLRYMLTLSVRPGNTLLKSGRTNFIAVRFDYHSFYGLGHHDFLVK